MSIGVTLPDIKLHLPWPPSANHIYTPNKNGGLRLSADVSPYRLMTLAAARTANIKKINDVDVSVMLECVRPDNLVRDIDNLPKAIFDACNKVVWGDDSQVKSLHIKMPRGSQSPGSITLSVSSGRNDLSILRHGFPTSKVILPWPISLNKTWLRIKDKYTGKLKTILNPKVENYRKSVLFLTHEAGLYRKYKKQDLKMEIVASPPHNKTIGDTDNILKVPIDALEKACVFHNDSQITEVKIIMDKPAGGQLAISIQEA